MAFKLSCWISELYLGKGIPLRTVRALTFSRAADLGALPFPDALAVTFLNIPGTIKFPGQCRISYVISSELSVVAVI